MENSNDKKIIIDYVEKDNQTNSKRIIDSTYGELRKTRGEDFDGFSKHSAFPIQDENGNKELVGIIKITEKFKEDIYMSFLLWINNNLLTNYIYEKSSK